jgi:general secretion pathway protein D
MSKSPRSRSESSARIRYRRVALAGASGLTVAFSGLPIAYAAPPPRPSSSGADATELSGDENLGHNACRKWPAGKRFTITVPKEAELEQLVQWMMTISCQKFIWTSKIRASKVTILSPEKVTLREAYAAFYAALESIGLTVEPAGDYFKIVESTAPTSRALPMYDPGATGPNNDRYITQLHRVENVDASEVAAVLKKLKGKVGSVETVNDLLIITDRGAVVRRLLKLVEQLDQPGENEKIFFYQLQYADAEDVADIVRDIFGEAKGKSKKSKKATSSRDDPSFSRVIVDERTGTLIIVARTEDYQTIQRLVQQLDVKLPGGGGRVQVKRLKNADPKEIAQVLNQLVGRAGGGSKKKSKSGNKSASQGGASDDLFAGEVKVTAHEPTRSLVITASAADYKNLESVIDRLDSERKQVYIEVYMLEAAVDRTTTLGAGAHTAIPAQNVAPYPGVSGNAVGLVSTAPASDVSSLVLSPDALTGLTGGFLGPLVPGSGQLLGLGNDVPAFGVIIHALQSNNDVNVVAEPHIYTADNEEAQLEVGERVPTPGQLSFGGQQGGSAFFPTQSINREDVTLEIKVTPHINDSTTVTLDVEIEDRAVKSTDPQLGVTTTKRRFKLGNILARDDNPVVLGGLIRERETINTQQVPGLGSIPLLGWLFKRRQKRKEKVNLLVVMVPHIIETPDDLRRVHERRTRERMEFIQRETGFKKRELETNVDYTSKSGMLGTVDREGRRLERDELLLRQAEEELAQEAITGEIGMSVRTTHLDTGSSSSSSTTKARTAKVPAKKKGK